MKLSIKKEDFITHIILNFLVTPVIVALSVISIYSGRAASLNICQKGTNFGLYLYEWLFLISMEKISTCCIISIISLFIYKFNRIVYFGTIVMMLDTIFSVIAITLGCLMIIDKNNVDCMIQNSNMWFMCIFDMTTLPLTIVYLFSYALFFKSDDINEISDEESQTENSV